MGVKVNEKKKHIEEGIKILKRMRKIIERRNADKRRKLK